MPKVMPQPPEPHQATGVPLIPGMTPVTKPFPKGSRTAEPALSATSSAVPEAALQPAAVASPTTQTDARVDILIDLIDPSPDQPRIEFDEEALAQLADTINDSGLINPIVVRRKPDGRFELVGGERRLRAHQMLRRTTIACSIIKIDDAEAAILAVADNDARENLSDYERGRGYKRLLDRGVVKTQTQLARRIGVSVPTISRCLAYFKLPAPVLEMLDAQPRLIGTTVVSDLASFAEDGHADLVIEAVQKVQRGALAQEQALNWLKSEVKRLAHPLLPKAPRQLVSAGRALADVKVDGRKVILSCPRDIDPVRLIAALERLVQSSPVQLLADSEPQD